jgi:hypothetical protein
MEDNSQRHISINSTTCFLPNDLAGMLSAKVGLRNHITSFEAIIPELHKIVT